MSVCGQRHSPPLPDQEEAQAAFKGIKSVLEGSTPLFTMQYPCHSPPDKKRWFYMSVSPVRGREFAAVVSHVDISEWHRGDGGAA
jgi:two-component system CheB/CheR fusion protein